MSKPSSSSDSTQRLQQISSQMAASTNSTKASAFSAEVVPQAAEDALFGLAREYKADKDPNKIDLGIGAYRDDNAKPWVLPVVKQVSKIVTSWYNIHS